MCAVAVVGVYLNFRLYCVVVISEEKETLNLSVFSVPLIPLSLPTPLVHPLPLNFLWDPSLGPHKDPCTTPIEDIAEEGNRVQMRAIKRAGAPVLPNHPEREEHRNTCTCRPQPAGELPSAATNGACRRSSCNMIGQSRFPTLSISKQGSMAHPKGCLCPLPARAARTDAGPATKGHQGCRQSKPHSGAPWPQFILCVDT